MRVRFILISLLLLGFYLIVSLSRDVWYLFRKEREIQTRQLKLEQLVSQNTSLKAKLEYYQSPAFVEKEARDKLGLAKKGETVILLPDNLAVEVERPQADGGEELSNWQQWWRLFTGE